ncbi:MAG TPA: hypothetical protein VK524_33330, partial [Polyangiaceae bacterium]|nr:hypothetical protein [Polyangiaceae bacterium]
MKLKLMLGCLLLSACGSDPIPDGQVRFTLGQEADTWTREPAPASIEIEKELTNGDRTVVSTLPPSATGFSLGSGDPGRYHVLGKDANGTVQVRGRSLWIDPLTFAGLTLPLFVGRAGEFARPPGEFVTEVGEGPLTGILFGEFVLMAEAGSEG